jgi:RNA polymerase sigma-70 factor (ECF subfamily)
MRDPVATTSPTSPTSPTSAAVFADLLGRLQAPLFGFVRGLLGDAEQAHDVVQDVFVDAWRAAQRGPSPFTEDGPEDGARRWLFHVAYHRTISVLRHRRVIAWEPFDADNPPEPGPFYRPVPFEDRIAEGEALRAALARLSPQDSACLLLSVVHGFTSTEIAQIAGIEPEAAKKRISRAKQRLRVAYFASEPPAEEHQRP